MTSQGSTRLPLMPAARLVAAGALAAGAMMLTAPAGNAIPESTIKSECDDAGGQYTIVTDGEHSYSRCCYLDINGVKHCDHYTDGRYTYETSNNTLEQPETPPPPPPPGGVVGPPATVATQAPPPMPDYGMTLWMPPPAGPVGPPPGEAVLAP
ncbi:hypothetical protein [Mycolicibacterium pyrenivorans]|uniref:hypothetical protein n=1 Tax=Mycolicibacterium pyrenivorans TaxID=187102 RepID=UPI0021F28EDB|nr:hypothetical protein [Mycolicibacterium pyrenivorans]MCV7154270.1 hypothetical protein [Mycolicibacterium pyrenivorans]